jgi:hypothetical protein
MVQRQCAQPKSRAHNLAHSHLHHMNCPEERPLCMTVRPTAQVRHFARHQFYRKYCQKSPISLCRLALMTALVDRYWDYLNVDKQ